MSTVQVSGTEKKTRLLRHSLDPARDKFVSRNDEHVTRLPHSDGSDLAMIEMLLSGPPIKNQKFQLFDNGMAAIQEFAWPRD